MNQCEINTIDYLEQNQLYLISNVCLHLSGELGMLVRNYLQSLLFIPKYEHNTTEQNILQHLNGFN